MVWERAEGGDPPPHLHVYEAVHGLGRREREAGVDVDDVPQQHLPVEGQRVDGDSDDVGAAVLPSARRCGWGNTAEGTPPPKRKALGLDE